MKTDTLKIFTYGVMLYVFNGFDSMAIPPGYLVGTLNGSSVRLDPAAVQFSAQWHILTNLGVHLTGYDKESRLVPDAATSWKISSDFTHYTFQLRHDVKDSTGRELTSSDWKASLSHLLSSNGSTHSFISEILSVEGILTPSKFVLELKLKKPYTSLLQRLTSPEFILLPENSIKEKSVDLNVTSGPYFVESLDKEIESIVLLANKFYYNYSPNQPQKIKMLNFKGGSYAIAEAVSKQKLNFAIMSIFPTDEKIELISSLISSKTIISQPVEPSNIALMVYSAKSKLTLQNRHALLSIFDKEGITKFNTSTTKAARQFFPPSLHGSLTLTEEKQLYNSISEKPEMLPARLRVYCSAAVAAKGLNVWVEKVFKKYHISYKIDIIESSKYRSERAGLDHDLYIMSTGVNSKDPAGSLLDMIDSKGGLIPDPDKKLISLLETSALGSKTESNRALNSLSNLMVAEGRIIPLFHYSTSIISSPDIKAEPPTMFDDELQLHTIRWK